METLKTQKVSLVGKRKEMTDEKEIKERILKKSEDMFIKFGYSKVTMDEVATELAMSKKTLYKFFPSKEHLIKSIINDVKCEISDYCDTLLVNREIDFIDKLKMLMNFFGKQAAKLRGPLLNDLQKTIPDCWTDLNEFRMNNAQKKFSDLLNEGIKAGAIRADIDQVLILLIYINTMQAMINPEMLSQIPYSSNQVFQTLIKIIFEGILSEEGRAKYTQHPVSPEATPR